jgi:hypothetical protein
MSMNVDKAAGNKQGMHGPRMFFVQSLAIQLEAHSRMTTDADRIAMTCRARAFTLFLVVAFVWVNATGDIGIIDFEPRMARFEVEAAIRRLFIAIMGEFPLERVLDSKRSKRISQQPYWYSVI